MVKFDVSRRSFSPAVRTSHAKAGSQSTEPKVISTSYVERQNLTIRMAAIVPAYWPMRAFWSAAAGEGYVAYLVIGATSCALALILAALMFERRLVRRG